jgi:hypothetical protein
MKVIGKVIYYAFATVLILVMAAGTLEAIAECWQLGDVCAGTSIGVYVYWHSIFRVVYVLAYFAATGHVP